MRWKHNSLERLLVADKEQQLRGVSTHSNHSHAGYLTDVDEVELHWLIVWVPLSPHLFSSLRHEDIFVIVLAPRLELAPKRCGEHDIVVEVGTTRDSTSMRVLDSVDL